MNGFEVFPNPNAGIFQIKFNFIESSDLELRLTNNLGQVIYQESLKQFQGKYDKRLDLSDYPIGVYNLQLVKGKKIISKQIIID